MSFAQNLKVAVDLITLPITLEALFDVVVVHFVSDKHPPSNIIKNCKLLYVHRFAVHCVAKLVTNKSHEI